MTSDGGRIGLAIDGGQVLLRFEGDVRLSLCTTLDDLIERLFDDAHPTRLLVDLGPAINIDSTCLGLIAKLGIETDRQLGFKPQIFCTNQDVQSQLDSLGLMPLFDVCGHAPTDDAQALSAAPCTAVDAQPVVLQAHRILMDLHASNEGRFQDLVQALDRS